MAVLAKFPMVSQLTATTSDGKPSNNAQMDCVPSSIGAVILWLQGKSQWDDAINPDKIKDAAYGEGYTGGTAASAYVAFCKSLGFDLYSVDTASASQSVSSAHSLLAQNKAAIFTEKDPYVPASYGWSHVCVFYADAAGELTAMDPYIGKAVTKSDAEWEQVLLGNQLWLVTPLEENVIDINSPNVGNFFEETGATHWKCKSNGNIIQYGILAFYCRNNGLLMFGLPLSNEVTLNAQGDAKQYFERSCLVYNPSHSLDNPPGSGSVYTAHIYSDNALGEDPLIPKLEATITQLQAQPATDQAAVDMVAKIKQIVNA
jgi:hypothetical protein